VKISHDVPRELLAACANPDIHTARLLSPPEEWFQPHETDDISLEDFDHDFDASAATPEGLLCGAYRIANTGCEGYHIYVFHGEQAGSVWSDQRVPEGKVFRIANDWRAYLEYVRHHKALPTETIHPDAARPESG